MQIMLYAVFGISGRRTAEDESKKIFKGENKMKKIVALVLALALALSLCTVAMAKETVTKENVNAQSVDVAEKA